MKSHYNVNNVDVISQSSKLSFSKNKASSGNEKQLQGHLMLEIDEPPILFILKTDQHVDVDVR